MGEIIGKDRERVRQGKERKKNDAIVEIHEPGKNRFEKLKQNRRQTDLHGEIER